VNWSFSDKVVLVTGAGAGAGLATARAFAAAGAAVVLADLHEASARSAAAALVGAHCKAIAIGCDVADDAQVAALVDRTVARFGRLDVAFNHDGDARGVALCMKHELRQMLRQHGGAIVNCIRVGGPAGVRANDPSGGILDLTRIAAMDYAAKGVRVTALDPGTLATPARAQLGGGAPEEIARAALWLCSPWARHVMGIPSPWTVSLRRAEVASEARALASEAWG
jgi:NAD(P)-dependent dehydrogenase (short-subunit alcohol dehydrogenase family)